MVNNEYSPEARDENTSGDCSPNNQQENNDHPKDSCISEEEYQFLLNELNMK